MMTWHEGDL
jgi:hypothetical protein